MVFRIYLLNAKLNEKSFNVLKEVHYELHGKAHKYRHNYAYVKGFGGWGGVASF
jgi:purine nucleoside permease